MPLNSLQSLMLKMNADMITPVRKSSSRATPMATVERSRVAVSALAKTTIEMHKQMSPVSCTCAVIPKTSLEQLLVKASETPAKINSHINTLYASTIGPKLKNYYAFR